MMDSNSNSYDMYSPKIEIDSEISESEREYAKDVSSKFKVHWNSENTMKLIETMEKDCKELWDIKNPLNKDRNARQARFDYLADIFGTTAEEVSRKIHNLRTQFNNELRKIKRRQVTRSGWEYFDALSFLMRTPAADPLETVDAVNLEITFKLTMAPQNSKERREKKRQAEMRRRSRIKNDIELHNAVKMKARERYYRRKAEGSVIPVSEMSSARKQVVRERNRINNRRFYQRKKEREKLECPRVECPGSPNVVEDPLCSQPVPASRRVTRQYKQHIEATCSSEGVSLDSASQEATSSSPPSPAVKCEFPLAEFQANEEEEFGAVARAHAALNNSNSSPNRSRSQKPLRVAASAPPPLPPSANPLFWPEEPTPRIRPGLNADECQIFGDFVASELRTLRSHESRKRLKRMIQKAILQIGEEEDVNIISG